MAENNVSLVVPDISCMHCAKAITEGVTPMAGVANIIVDVETKTVTVTFDTDVTDESAIREKLAELGYPAT